MGKKPRTRVSACSWLFFPIADIPTDGVKVGVRYEAARERLAVVLPHFRSGRWGVEERAAPDKDNDKRRCNFSRRHRLYNEEGRGVKS
jgi:hypothetical protein